MSKLDQLIEAREEALKNISDDMKTWVRLRVASSALFHYRAQQRTD
jgi:hypothetical protein